MSLFLKEIIKRFSQGEQVLIAGLGDSLTYGWMVQQGFFDRFEDRLAEAYPRAGIEFIKDGVPGSTAKEGLGRVDSILREKPDVVIVQFALNDCFSGMPIDEFESAYLAIAEKVISGQAIPILATSCPVMDQVFDRELADFYDTIVEIADQLQVPAADLAAYWRSRQAKLDDLQVLYQSDGAHPTDHGHALMAAGLLELFDV
ncbi:MAG: SGNH/GDSL hydrolase family protein [Deltaproteobacteria bacterium]|nr:SGNH/GDSL hydrolase family protein [Deltaproteobacteria bacterium]MBW1870925.1 SGNH/GDSL hydrolase family protein [Deltaproteobacteria bacterium]